MQLHEVVDHHTRLAGATLGYREDTLWFELGAEQHRSQNPVADARTANTSYKLTGGYAPAEDFHWFMSYVLTDIDSRVRTNFYFDPSPAPVSTQVGFAGEPDRLVKRRPGGFEPSLMVKQPGPIDHDGNRHAVLIAFLVSVPLECILDLDTRLAVSFSYEQCAAEQPSHTHRVRFEPAVELHPP